MLVLHLNRFSDNHGFFVSKFFISIHLLVGCILSPCLANEFMVGIFPTFFPVENFVDFITLSNGYRVLPHSHLQTLFCYVPSWSDATEYLIVSPLDIS